MQESSQDVVLLSIDRAIAAIHESPSCNTPEQQSVLRYSIKVLAHNFLIRVELLLTFTLSSTYISSCLSWKKNSIPNP